MAEQSLSILRYFLPANYPVSVAPEYFAYVKWLFASSVIGSTIYVMTMSALLQSVNVSSNAVGIAAGVSWVLKDGLGSLGMILSSYFLGDRFDEDTKRSRWRADVLANVGAGLELLTAVFPQFFVVLATVGNVLKGISGLTWGACNAAINRHLARHANLGDLTAKTTTQRMVAFLIGSAAGMYLTQSLQGIASSQGSPSSPSALPWGFTGLCYVVLVAFHLYGSYRFVIAHGFSVSHHLARWRHSNSIISIVIALPF